MRLKTKLVLAATTVTFGIVIVLSMLFLGELLRQRIVESAASNDLMAREVRVMTQQAVQTGLLANPPEDGSELALREAVIRALKAYPALQDTMDAFVRYSPTIQDVSVTDAGGRTLVSTDPLAVGKPAASRRSFKLLQGEGVLAQAREVFGTPRVLDVTLPLDLSGRPFLVIHLGVRSSFLENNFVPWLRVAGALAVGAGLISVLAAALLASLALRPIEEISRRLERLTGSDAASGQPALAARAARTGLGIGLSGLTANPLGGPDAVLRVTDTIDRLGRQMRTTEAGLSDLQTNLNQMLDTLRDGVVLFTAERRAVMVSDAVAHFLELERPDGPVHGHGVQLVGRSLDEIFVTETALGQAVLEAFEREANVISETVLLEDGREVEFSLDRIDDHRGAEAVTRGGRMGTLLTLRDKGSALRLEQELEVSRRLAAVGRLTANVGHEVKNPINAMVVHLELLRSKLEEAGQERRLYGPMMRHVDILAGEMERLDRVVQTLADFTRPVELHFEDVVLGTVVDQVVELTREEMAAHGVEVRCAMESARVRADGELLRQALLNLLLNGMQAMPRGGVLWVRVSCEPDAAVIEVADEGEGIQPELIPRIFELYFTTKPTGSGIGLAMTYRIVQMHGGAMEVASQPGQGAVFTMRLPLRGGKLIGQGPAGVQAGKLSVGSRMDEQVIAKAVLSEYGRQS
jgi:signal transduction histidine kinase